jgi:RNA polymerase sigma factor (sigma-70 family)
MPTMNDPEPQDAFLPTRQSLLSRLRSWDNQDSWREFFDTYWHLLYDCAIKAGLDATSAQDAVQETVIAVAKQMPEFRYNPAKGSFKGWLLRITKRRVADQFRRRQRARIEPRIDPHDPAGEAALARLAEQGDSTLDRIWDKEWAAHLTATAMARVKRVVNAEQFQMFELYAVKGWPVGKVARTLGVSSMKVYLAKHRVGAVLKKQVRNLEARMEA